MGVIKRQSIKKSIVSYVGVAIGAVNTMFIYPYEKEALGLISFLVATALLALPIATLGAKLLAVRFFPDFKNSKNAHNGYLGLLLLIILTGFSVFCLLFLFFQEQIRVYYSQGDGSQSNPLLLEYLPYVIGFTLFLALIEVLSAYISNFHRVVVPHIINNLWIKIALPTLIVLVAAKWIDYTLMVQLYLGVLGINVLLLLAYLAHLKELRLHFNFSFLTKERVRSMRNYALFGILGSVGSFLATQIDLLMAASMIDFGTTGVYRMASFFANTIEIPMLAMISITSPIVSEASKNKDYQKIGTLYKKTSITLFIAGTFIYCLIILNLDFLLNLLNKGDVIREGKYVIYILGAAKLFDLVTSINGHIINYSKYYRFSLYALLLLGVLNILLNQLFIPLFHINGIALATLVSLVLYNCLKLIYVYFRFNLLPFTRQTVFATIIAIACTGLAWMIPDTGYNLLNIALKTAVFGTSFISSTLYLNLAPDINHLVRENIERLRHMLNGS